MEVFIARFDYQKEREDLLSFKEGEKFRIASKADKKWWAAYSETGDYGYIPSSYMERYVDPMEGENVQNLSESEAGVRKRQALQELRNNIQPTPAAVTIESDGSEDSSESEKNDMIIKPLRSLSVTSEDADQIEPKKLCNPVMESKTHMRLHKELRLNHSRGGIQSILGKPELQKMWQRRRPDADGKLGSIRESERNGVKTGNSCMDNELATQLARRSQLVETEPRSSDDQQKPEFMKVSLRKTLQQ